MVFIGHEEGDFRVGYWVDKVRWEGLRDCGLGEDWRTMSHSGWPREYIVSYRSSFRRIGKVIPMFPMWGSMWWIFNQSTEE